MHPYLIRNIGPPSSMFHHHRVPLFAFQSFICPSHVLTHSCASHPLSCKCSAQSRLSMTITALAVYQAWLCPLVWCCLIHHEDLNRSFILCIILRIVIALIVRIVPTPSWLSISHKLASSWNNTLQVMLSPVFMEIIQSSRHASHSLQWKTHRCMLNVLLHGFLSACQIRSWKEMRWHHQCCSSPMFMRWSALLRFRIDGPTVSLGGVHLSMFIQMHSPDNICQES
jgi:hypothetical protein